MTRFAAVAIALVSMTVLAGCFGGGGGGGAPIPQSPPTVSGVTVTGTAGDVTVGYALSDANGDSSAIAVQWRRGATAWSMASVSGTLTGVAPGSGRTLTWRSAADLPGIHATDVEVRVTPTDDDGVGVAGLCGPCEVDNSLNAAPTIANLQIGESVDGDIGLGFQLADTDTPANLAVTIEYRVGAETVWHGATLDSTQPLTLGLGNQTVTWHSATDLAGVDTADCQYRVLASDGVATGSAESVRFAVDNNAPPVASNLSLVSGTSGDISFSFELADAEGDALAIRVEYHGGTVLDWTEATVLGQTAGLAPGSGHTITWATQSDQPGVVNDYEIRVVPLDADEGTGTSGVFTVDNTGSTNARPVASAVTLASGSGDLAVGFTLADAEDDPCSVVVQFRTVARGDVWTTATVTGAVTGLATPGTYDLVWRSGVDLAGEDVTDARIRVVPRDATGTGTAGVSAAASVDNNQPPVATVATIVGDGGQIQVTYALTDAEGDACTLAVHFKRQADADWTPATLVGAPDAVYPGVGLTLVWDSDEDLPLADVDDVLIRITPSDADEGTAGTSALFAVDNNDSPTAIVLLSDGTVAENEPSGTSLGTLSATDPDLGDTHTFALVDGTGSDDNAAFTVDGTSTLWTAAVLDFEAGATRSIRVRVTDSAGNTYEQALTVTVTDVNEAPTALTLSNATVDENAPGLTTVGTFSATDPDAGTSFTYTLASGDGDTDNAAFSIPDNATLRTLAAFDYETKNSYSVRVRVTDGGGLFFERQFTVAVNDVNEAPTGAYLVASTSVPENSAVGTFVDNLEATDPDDGGSHTFTLVAGTGDTHNALFTVVGNELRTAAVLDYEAGATRTVRVQVTDQGGLSFATPVTVGVEDVNDAPTDIALSASDVDENQVSGTVVGALSATDQDPGDTHTYTLVAGTGSTDNASFTISGADLLTAASFDYETKSSYAVRIRATDSGAGNLYFEQAFTVTVSDVNEAPTNLLIGDLPSAEVNENLPADTAVCVFTPTDQDADDTFTYQLYDTDGYPDNGAFTMTGATLKTAVVFDYETKSNYSICVRVTDSGAATYTGVFTIAVGDLNDAPTFTAGDDVTVDEDSAPYSAAWAIGPNDNDGGDQNAAFQLSKTGGDDGLFTAGPAIDASGTLSFTLAENAFGSATYSVTLVDEGGTTAGGVDTSEAESLTITVNAVNDPPAFDLPDDPDVNVLEDSGAYTATGFATNVTAGPANEGQTPVFTVTNDANGLFSTQPDIDEATGTLTFTPAADANGTANVTVSLGDGVTSTADQTFEIAITAVNDPPSFVAGAIPVPLPEDCGEQTGTGWASDISAGPADEAGQTCRFAVFVKNEALFAVLPAVSAATGDLTFTPADDAHGESLVTITIVDDAGTPLDPADDLAGTEVSFLLVVEPRNDAPRAIALDVATLAENAGEVAVGVLSATDPDEGDVHSFALVEGGTNNDDFEIRENEGTYTLWALGDLDFEDATHGATRWVRVRATDTSDATCEQSLEITLTNVNEAPTDIALSNATLTENAAVGTVIGTLSATDPDAGDSSTYAVQGSYPWNSRVTVDGDTLKSAHVVDFETDPSFTVGVRVTDGGGLTFDREFTVTVTDVNEAPTFTAGTSPVEVAEDSTSGSAYSAPWATDLDDGDGGDQNASFDLTKTSGADGLFSDGPAIDDDGNLTFTLTPDAFGSATFSVTLVDDGGTDDGGVDTSEAESLTVTVTPVNDPPSFSVGGELTAIMGSGEQTQTGWVTAVDPGATNESLDDLSFTVSADPASLFLVQPAIDTDGTLTFTPAADQTGDATVTVTLTDDGGTTDEGDDHTTSAQTFTVHVIERNHAPTFTDGDPVTVDEDSGAYSALWATDIDDGDLVVQALTFHVTYSDGDTDLFVPGHEPAIAADGTLTFTPAPDANGFALYTVTLSDDGGTLNDGADTSIEHTLTITVDPVNDPPTFTSGGDVFVDPSLVATGDYHYDAPWASDIAAGPQDEIDGGQTVSFAITDNSNAGIFQVILYSPWITADGSLKFVLKPGAAGEATLTVRADDTAGASSTPLSFRIAVDGAPHSIALDPPSPTVPENEPAGTFVGTLSATDPEGTTVTFELAEASEDNDNFWFAIVGNELRTAAPFDYEDRNTLWVEVVARDAQGNETSEWFTVAVGNEDEPYPDFYPNFNDVPWPVYPGQRIFVDCVLYNGGAVDFVAGPEGAVRTKLYLSLDDVPDGGDTEVGFFDAYEVPLDGDALHTFAVDIPADAAPESQLYFFLVANTEGLTEVTRRNNVSGSSTRVEAGDLPNLVVTALTVHRPEPDGAGVHPPALRDGSSIAGSLTLAEDAGQPVDGWFNVGMILTSGPEGSYFENYVTSFYVTSLAANGSVDRLESWYFNSLPAGRYTLGVRADIDGLVAELDETDNDFPADPAVVAATFVDVLPAGAADAVDLAVGDVSLEGNVQGPFAPGTVVQVRGNLASYGALPSEMLVSVQWSPALGDGEDWQTLGSLYVNPSDTDYESTFSLSVVLPDVVGPCHLRAYVEPFGDDDANPSDNASSPFTVTIADDVTPRVDLVAHDADAVPLTVRRGDPFTLSYELTVGGTKDFDGNILVTFYASEDDVITDEDVELGFISPDPDSSEGTHALGGRLEDTFSECVLPLAAPAAPAGGWYVGFIVTATGGSFAEDESTMGDNACLLDMRLHETLEAKPDLICLLVDPEEVGATPPLLRFPILADCDGPNPIAANLGSLSVTDPRFTLYFSPDEVVDPLNDVALGDRQPDSLPAGWVDENLGQFTLDTIGVGAGSGWLYVLADPLEVCAELDETNNDSVGLTLDGRQVGTPVRVVISDAPPADLVPRFDHMQGTVGDGYGWLFVSGEVINRSYGRSQTTEIDSAEALPSAVSLWASTDSNATIGESDAYLGTVAVGRIPGGGRAAFNLNLALPAGFAPEATPNLKIMADSLREVDETEEGVTYVADHPEENNVVVVALENLADERPGPVNLTCAVLDAPSMLNSASGELPVRVRVARDGAFLGTPVSCALYVSDDETLDDEDDHLATEVVVLGGSSSADVQFSTFSGTPGSGARFFIAVVDAPQVVDETNDDDNASTAVAVVVYCDDAETPDLVPGGTVLVSPSGVPVVRPGEAVTARVTVKPGNEWPAGAFDVDLFLSPGGSLDGAELSLGDAARIPLLPGNGTAPDGVAAELHGTVPVLPPGRYYLGGILDPDDEIHETNDAAESNHDTFATGLAPIDVVDPIVDPATVDLAADGLWLDFDNVGVLRTGSAVVFTGRIRNAGGPNLPATFDVSVYRVTGNESEPYELVGSASTLTPADLTRSDGEVRVEVLLPAEYVAGSYTFVLGVDCAGDTDETNDFSEPLLLTLSDHSGAMDLMAEEMDAPLTPRVVRDGSFYVPFSFTLAGTTDHRAEAPGFSVKFYASLDGTLDASDVHIGTRSYANAIVTLGARFGDTELYFAECTMAGDGLVTGDAYHVIAFFEAAFAEADTTNNTAVSASKVTVVDPAGPDAAADLVCLLFPDRPPTAPTVTVAAGTSPSILPPTVGNFGAVASGPTVVRYFLSTSQSVLPGDRVDPDGIADVAVSGMPAGCIYEELPTPTLAFTGVAPGAYWLYALVDPDGTDVDESDEDNNDSATLTLGVDAVGQWVRVVVTAPEDLRPDLHALVDEASGSTDLVSSYVSVAGVVLNGALGTTAGSSVLSVYVSDDDDPESLVGDVYAGSVAVLPLAGGDRFGGDLGFPLDVPLPTESPRWVKVVVDSLDEVDEGVGEGNNVTVVPLTVEVVLPDLTGAFIDSPSMLLQSDTSWTVATRVTNGGNATAGPFSVSLYLTDDVVGNPTQHLLGTYAVTGGLARGASRAVFFGGSGGTAVPSVSGACALVLVVDALGDVGESDETNNRVDAGVTVITEGEKPDIDAGSVSFDVALGTPPARRRGTSLTLRALASNSTANPTADYGVELYAGSSPAPGTLGDTLVGEGSWSLAGLAEDAALLVDCLVPLDAPLDRLYVGALHDRRGDIPETDEGNNVSPEYAAVDVLPRAMGEGEVDLTPGSANVAADGGSVTVDTKVVVWLKVDSLGAPVTTVSGDGMVWVHHQWFDAGTGVSVPGASGTQAFTADEINSGELELLCQAPSSAGTYRLAASIDIAETVAEADETNNDSLTEAFLQVVAAGDGFDLVAGFPEDGQPPVLEYPVPTLLEAGTTVSFPLPYQIRGDTDVRDGYLVWLSLVSTADLLTPRYPSFTIVSGGDAHCAVGYEQEMGSPHVSSLNLAGAVPGDYYYRLALAPNAPGLESDATNNVAVFTDVPVTVVAAGSPEAKAELGVLAVNPDVAESGTLVLHASRTGVAQLSGAIAYNTGAVAANDVVVNVYAATSANVDLLNDALLGSTTVSLAPGQTIEPLPPITLDLTQLPAGDTLHLYAYIDPSDFVDEVNDSNNASPDATLNGESVGAWVELRVDATDGGKPDLAGFFDWTYPEAPQGPSTHVAGGIYLVNQGLVGTTGAFAGSVWLSGPDDDTAAILPTDLYLGTRAFGHVAPGALLEVGFNLELPAGLALANGDYRLKVRLDSLDEVDEVDEANNVVVSGIVFQYPGD